MSVNLADRAIPQIVNDLADVLEQGLELIGNICPNEYAAAPCGIQASSIGAHYRHHLEHVQILLVARPGQLIDYDNRERDPLIETDRDVAIERTEQLLGNLRLLSEDDLDRPLEMAHRTCVKDSPRIARSTLRRELLFLTSHAIHHYALMKLVLELTGHRLDASFGVMPSTLAHLAEQGCGE
ncbi:MAG: DinB family protein [Myxococcota bacterium]|jgi:uncharacterized damage-inducible protein DinB|nr:DinB family protein [Myxococcota bacterium]